MAHRYEGKAKIVEDAPGQPDLVRITFKDDTTAGDGARHEQFAGKGTCCAEISCLIFEHLREQGIASHYVRRDGDHAIIARRVQIIPLEVVVRNVTAGSLCRRIGVKPGQPIEPPFVEFYLKDDALHDPLVTDDYIRLLKLATPEELASLRRQALQVNEAMRELFRQAGLLLVDFKLEYGRAGGELLLADEISPDSLRLWDHGRSLDKDVFRRGEGSPLGGYREVLERIRPLITQETPA